MSDEAANEEARRQDDERTPDDVNEDDVEEVTPEPDDDDNDGLLNPREEAPKDRGSKRWGLIAAIVAIVAAIIAVLLLDSTDTWPFDNSSAPTTVTATPQPSTSVSTVQGVPNDCPTINGKAWPLNYDPNRKGDVVEGGVKNVNDILNASAKDPRALSGFAHHYLPKLYPNSTDGKEFVDQSGKCLNADGVKAWNRLETILLASNTIEGEADPSHVNTGMGGVAGVVSNAVAGIDGNLKALITILPDGTIKVVLQRCGNPVEERPSYPRESTPPMSTPPVTTTPPCQYGCVTTTPPVTTTTTTSPPCVPPPGNTQCMPPKSPTHNPVQPPGETQHPSPPRQVEATPPPPPAVTFNPTVPTNAPPVTTVARPAPVPSMVTRPGPATTAPPTQAVTSAPPRR